MNTEEQIEWWIKNANLWKKLYEEAVEQRNEAWERIRELEDAQNYV